MSIDDLMVDLRQRLGRRVTALFTRDGDPAEVVEVLYQPSPAGFGGRLICGDNQQFAWELWLEDEQTWNVQFTALND